MRGDDKAKIIDLKKIIAILVSRWYIIAASVIIAFTIAFVKLRYTVPLYTSSINVKIDDERGGQISDFFRYGRATGRIDNVLKTESEIIRSKALSEKALVAMNDHFTYAVEGNILTTKLYPNPLFEFTPVYIDSANYGAGFRITFSDSKHAVLIIGGSKQDILVEDTIMVYNSMLLLKVLNEKALVSYYGTPVDVSINHIASKAGSCAANVGVDNIKGTSILTISFTSDVPAFATAFVNTLAQVYMREVVNNKSVVAEQTIKFIENQLDELSGNVRASQQSLAEFKSENQGITPDELSKKDFDQLVEYQTEINLENIKRKLIENAVETIKRAQNKPVDLVTLGVDEASDVRETEKVLNAAILERISLLQRYGPDSKILIDNMKRIDGLKSAVLSSLMSSLDKSNEKVKYYKALVAAINTNLKDLPQKQQSLINLERDYKVNEKIFSYLLEKRLETLISKASIIPNAAIIDRSGSAIKVFPDDKKNYSVAISLALLISFSIIGLMRVVYDKIPNKETIEELSEIPVIGVIKKINTSSTEADYNIHVLNSPKSIFSESIRGIRTNIDYLLGGKKNQIISLTSTVSGEGKTFCTLNLAASLTLLGNRVLIIGCDLRRPKIHLSFRDLSNRIGLTSYLFGKHTLEEIIMTTSYEGLYVIPAGPVPPNPSELLQSDTMKQMLEKLRGDFDYVFLDTAPVGLVSDSFPLLKAADINLYILRAQYSKRDFAVIPDRLKADNEIAHLYTILNSFDSSGAFYASIYKNDYGGYYGGGGYYYYGGNYGENGYGYYGKKYESYYSGYYTEEEIEENRRGWKRFFRNLLKSFKRS